ncbi:sodium channel subunit beta-3 isoform X2 [Podarcis raffonei]|uniref:sodium channel subunit beta-3 isoform X2 n=1 Tax=Podarcis raffonei TaxID=65483 RepID=UPI002329118F|nr:sodium channel subunit beta-3 isoform X2 [Podarcis raffonei]
MAALTKVAAASSLLVVVLCVGVCSSVCVEVPSETEAVQGSRMKLLCISCMKREEVSANTLVQWYYKTEGGIDEPIYKYENEKQELGSRFRGRLQWDGSIDMQDVSISVLNISLNDSGIYTCNVTREFNFEVHRPVVTRSTLIRLTVVEEAQYRTSADGESKETGNKRRACQGSRMGTDVALFVPSKVCHLSDSARLRMR